MIKVSIVTPVFNSEKYIEKTIISVKNQTFRDWEMIFIDDFSTDKSVAIIQKYMLNDKRLKYIQNDKNYGQAYSRNQGIKVAQGEYIALLDSDDLWYPNKLQEHIELMIHQELDFTYSNYELINEQGIALNSTVYAPAKLDANKLLRYNGVGCLTAVFSQKIVGDSRFEPDRVYQGIEDNMFWVNLFRKNDVKYAKINKVLAIYRLRYNSSSGQKIIMLKKRYNMLKNYYKLDSFTILRYMLYYVTKNALKALRKKLK